MPSSTLIASGTLGRVPGSTGASYQSHLVFAANSQRWWYFTAVGASSASGTATGSGQSTSQLVDTSKSFTANAFTNFSLWFTGGTGANQVIRLTGNTATALTMTTSTGESNCQTAPVAGSTTYEVINFNLIRAWVSSSSDLTTATWSEATGSSGGITFPTGQLNWAGGDSVAGGAGLNPADGRLWAVGYGSVSSKDVVYLQAQTNIHWLQNMGRATLSGSTITWDTNGNGTGTNQWFVPGASQDGIATFPSGLDVALSTSGPKWASVGGNWAPNNDANGVFNQTNETGGANPTVAWDSTTETYDSTINNNWGGGVVALGSGFMLSVFVDGGTTDTTGKVYNNLRYAESASATGWPTTNTGAAIPNLSSASNDPDDWGIVARTTTDVHVIRRNSGTALEQIRYSGHNGSWGSKVNLPTTGLTGQLAASGVAAVSDGTSVWAFVIDTDANNSVRYIKWNGSWDASWSTLSTGTEVKNFITATIRSDGQQIGVAWTANSSSPFQVNYSVLSVAGLTSPLKNSASNWVLIGRGGRRALRRVGYWHLMADQVNTGLIGSAEVLQTTISHSPVTSGAHGRRPRRTGQWWLSSNQTQTVYQDVVISVPHELPPNRRRIRKFLNWDFVANFLQNLLPPPPLKNSAAYWVLFGRGGRRAQRRVGYWHQIADQVNTSLAVSGEVVQSNISHSPVVGGRPGRRPRRVGQWWSTSNQTQTVFTDVAIGQSQMRAFRRWLRKFLNWDLPAANRILNFPQQAYAGTATIFDYVYDSRGKAVVGTNVTVQLALASGLDTAQIPNVLLLPVPQTVTTDLNGYWQATVIPNGQIQPGSNYTVEVEGAIVYKVNVPNAPGLYQTLTILN